MRALLAHAGCTRCSAHRAPRGLDALELLGQCVAISLCEWLECVEYNTGRCSRCMFSAADPHVLLQKLFKYIGGKNDGSQKIDMTAPVRVLVHPSDGPFCKSNFTISFYLPPDFQVRAAHPAIAHVAQIWRLLVVFCTLNRVSYTASITTVKLLLGLGDSHHIHCATSARQSPCSETASALAALVHI